MSIMMRANHIKRENTEEGANNMDRNEKVVESSCFSVHQNLTTGNITVCPRIKCDPERDDPDLELKLFEMALLLTEKNGKLQFVCENDSIEQST